jgi:hypothetical protein
MKKPLPILHPNDARYGIHIYRDEIIEGKRVEIGAGQIADQFLGTTFIDCEIRLRSSGHATGVIISQSVFNNCAILPLRIQRITNLKASFEKCVFKGTYEIEFSNDVLSCSFVEAKLNHALFFKPIALDSVAFPKWPHIVISQLDEYGDDFLSTVPRMSLIWYMAKKRPHTIVVNLDKATTSPHETWQAIKDKSYVSFGHA